MTTKVIVGGGTCEGKRVIVDVVELDSAGEEIIKERKMLGPNEFVEYYIWVNRELVIREMSHE